MTAWRGLDFKTVAWLLEFTSYKEKILTFYREYDCCKYSHTNWTRENWGVLPPLKLSLGCLEHLKNKNCLGKKKWMLI